ncbi:anaphase-promoting complex subunit cdc27 [Microbotryomycetes sp. JL221]|nr:anaphase-promoting complex subunit cdc27 [Microbotryomycetes sp. JL221]
MAGFNTTPVVLQLWMPPGASRGGTVHATRQALLRHITVTTLATSPTTALFFAERLHALDATSEANIFLLAFTLAAVNQPLQAMHALKKQVTVTTRTSSIDSGSSNGKDWTPDDASLGHFNAATRMTTTTTGIKSSRSTKSATQASLRCARLYAKCCLQLGKAQEGRVVLDQAARAAATNGLSQAPPDPQLDNALSIGTMHSSNSRQHTVDAVAIALELAHLAAQAREHERAIQAYHRALDAQSWCWEAIEGLCAHGAPIDSEALYPSRPRHPTTAAPISPLPQQAAQSISAATTSVAARAYTAVHPPPLGPSQTSVVNSAGVHRTRSGHENGGLGFFTPIESTAPILSKPKDTRGALFAPGGVNRKPVNKTSESLDTTMDERTSGAYSSFEASFYPQGPLSFGQPVPAHPVQTVAASSNGSLFTPPAISSLGASTAPGVKRSRGGTPQVSSKSDDSRHNGSAQGRAQAAVDTRLRPELPRPTRRSSRLSKDHGTLEASSRAMVLTRSQQNTTGSSSTGPVGSRSSRDKKRSKAGAGPAVLSDVSSEFMSPQSHSSSPGPSSPGGGGGFAALDSLAQSTLSAATIQEAEDYVFVILRCFGRAAACAAKYESAKCIEALMALPLEQQKTWRAQVGLAKAHMELLTYDKAERAFSQARQTAPFLLDSMEAYSTLLWHMRASLKLSCLAQDLMVVAPKSAPAWIAAGNVFSHLDDHSAALKCFKRAAQVDKQCVYAFTLSGHECVALEDFERALNFFREAIRLDERHYNAWFGIGNVYLQTGQFRLAEFHFRKATEINPSNAALLCCVGAVLEKRKQLAESDLIALKDRAPNEFTVHYLLGKLYKTLKRTPEMLKHFGLAQDIEPRMASLIREQIEREVMDIDEQA